MKTYTDQQAQIAQPPRPLEGAGCDDAAIEGLVRIGPKPETRR